MNYNTTKVYSIKREILTFSKKISKNLSRPDQKFVADMLYGILASGSCLLSDISDRQAALWAEYKEYEWKTMMTRKRHRLQYVKTG